MLPPDDVPGPLGAPRPSPASDVAARARALLEQRPHWVAAAVVAVGALALVAWLAGGADPPSPEASLPLAGTAGAGAAEAPGATADPGATTSSTAPTELVVHAAGAVRRPGLYRLPAGARVDDLVAAAGGLADNADADRINLALLLSDGERVYLPAVGQAQVPEAPAPTGAPAAGGSGPTVADGPGGAVNINTADVAQLETLPGVGPVTAQAIVDHRTQEGPFASVDDLLAVQGIGEAKLAALRDQVTV